MCVPTFFLLTSCVRYFQRTLNNAKMQFSHRSLKHYKSSNYDQISTSYALALEEKMSWACLGRGRGGWPATYLRIGTVKLLNYYFFELDRYTLNSFYNNMYSLHEQITYIYRLFHVDLYFSHQHIIQKQQLQHSFSKITFEAFII